MHAWVREGLVRTRALSLPPSPLQQFSDGKVTQATDVGGNAAKHDAGPRSKMTTARKGAVGEGYRDTDVEHEGG